MARRELAPYVVPTVVAGVASIVGGALISSAWTGDAGPSRKTAAIAGVGFLTLGAVIAFWQLERG